MVELSRHLGEWVQIGEPVMRLVRLDRLRVNGVLDAKDYRPSEIQDRPVRVVVAHPSRRRSPRHSPARSCTSSRSSRAELLQVRAEVQNRKQDGVWILNPGMKAEMTIELK